MAEEQRGHAPSQPRLTEADVVLLIDGKPYIGRLRAAAYVSPWVQRAEAASAIEVIKKDGELVPVRMIAMERR